VWMIASVEARRTTTKNRYQALSTTSDGVLGKAPVESRSAPTAARAQQAVSKKAPKADDLPDLVDPRESWITHVEEKGQREEVKCGNFT
jgi:hypothetical protein